MAHFILTDLQSGFDINRRFVISCKLFLFLDISFESFSAYNLVYYPKFTTFAKVNTRSRLFGGTRSCKIILNVPHKPVTL